MKIVYDETEINAVKTILRHIQVTGDQQATLLAMLAQTIRNGKELPEPNKKIVYDETEINAAKTILRQIQVTGDQQATLLAMLGQTIRNGKELPEPNKKKPKTTQTEKEKQAEEEK